METFCGLRVGGPAFNWACGTMVLQTTEIIHLDRFGR
jgi:hypothetical protein